MKDKDKIKTQPVAKSIAESDSEELSAQTSASISNNPVLLFMITVFSIFLAELIIMFIISTLPPISMFTEAVIDSSLLIVIVFPILYYFIFRPLNLQIAENKQVREKLQKVKNTSDIHVKGRTTELIQANEQLRQEVTERKLVAERLEKLTECFMNFVPDPLKNINRLTAFCGELLGATCALYNRLDEGMLCSWGQWNTPPDYNPVDRPEGHICYDVIKYGGDQVFVVRNLPETPYAQTDPNVLPYKLQTYIGKSVKFGSDYVGSLCVVFQNDYVPSEEDKSLLKIIASAIGVEEKRKQAEEYLRESESKLSAITDTATDAIIMTDNKGRVSYWNPAAERMFGYNSEKVIGYDIEPLIVPPRYRKSHRKGLHEFVETGEGSLIGKTCGVSALRKDGTEFPVELSISKIMVKGLWYSAGIIRDITERKKLEDQLLQSQKMEAVGQLAGGIAHDFNNILTAIMSYGNILQMKMDKADDALRSYVDAILTSSERAAHLTKGLLSFSRKQVLNLVPIDLNDIIKKAQSLLSIIICEDVTFRTNLTDQVLPVMADSAQIEQALMNLVTNACDVMSQGGELTISSERVELDKGFIKTHELKKAEMYALLSITDTGAGMDEETIQRIFEPFFTTKEVGKGTGLGLAITYGIIKQHNGYINIESEAGKGTTFKIHLPLIKEKVEKEKPADATLVGGTETVLIAEDEESVRSSLRLILQEYGYTVIETADGEGAIEKFMENKDSVQLLILDVVMPKKKGKEVYEEIKRVRPDIKVIFTSGYTAGIIHTKNVLKEGLHFISKPVSPKNLLRKIREVLDT